MNARKANSVFDEALVWDMVWPIAPEFGNDWARLAEFRNAGFNVVSVTLAGDNHNSSQALAMVAAARRYVLTHPELILMENVADGRRAKRTGKLAVALHFEGTRCFERNLDLVEAFYTLGVRHTLLAFNQTNSAGGGCAEEDDGGLSRFGRSLIRQMERVGMLLDLSHVGRRTSLEAMAASSKPVVFTHSNAAAIHPHFRNLSNEQIKACAATGGLVGVSGSSAYLGCARASTASIFRHLDHVVQLVGPAHAGIGLDVVFGAEALSAWMRERPDEWPGVEAPDWPGVHYAAPQQLRELCDHMARGGYDDAAIEDILGRNYERICQRVWS